MKKIVSLLVVFLMSFTMFVCDLTAFAAKGDPVYFNVQNGAVGVTNIGVTEPLVFTVNNVANGVIDANNIKITKVDGNQNIIWDRDDFSALIPLDDNIATGTTQNNYIQKFGLDLSILESYTTYKINTYNSLGSGEVTFTTGKISPLPYIPGRVITDLTVNATARADKDSKAGEVVRLNKVFDGDISTGTTIPADKKRIDLLLDESVTGDIYVRMFGKYATGGTANISLYDINYHPSTALETSTIDFTGCTSDYGYTNLVNFPENVTCQKQTIKVVLSTTGTTDEFDLREIEIYGYKSDAYIKNLKPVSVGNPTYVYKYVQNNEATENYKTDKEGNKYVSESCGAITENKLAFVDGDLNTAFGDDEIFNSVNWTDVKGAKYYRFIYKNTYDGIASTVASKVNPKGLNGDNVYKFLDFFIYGKNYKGSPKYTKYMMSPLYKVADNSLIIVNTTVNHFEVCEVEFFTDADLPVKVNCSDVMVDGNNAATTDLNNMIDGDAETVGTVTEARAIVFKTAYANPVNKISLTYDDKTDYAGRYTIYGSTTYDGVYKKLADFRVDGNTNAAKTVDLYINKNNVRYLRIAREDDINLEQTISLGIYEICLYMDKDDMAAGGTHWENVAIGLPNSSVTVPDAQDDGLKTMFSSSEYGTSKLERLFDGKNDASYEYSVPSSITKPMQITIDLGKSYVTGSATFSWLNGLYNNSGCYTLFASNDGNSWTHLGYFNNKVVDANKGNATVTFTPAEYRYFKVGIAYHNNKNNPTMSVNADGTINALRAGGYRINFSEIEIYGQTGDNTGLIVTGNMEKRRDNENIYKIKYALKNTPGDKDTTYTMLKAYYKNDGGLKSLVGFEVVDKQRWITGFEQTQRYNSHEINIEDTPEGADYFVCYLWNSLDEIVPLYNSLTNE